MEHHAPPAPDDVIIQVSAAAVAAVDDRSSTSQIEEVGDGGDDDVKTIIGDAGGLTRRTFSESYRMRHRNPMVRAATAPPLFPIQISSGC